MAMYAWHFDFSVELLWTIDAFLSAAECTALIEEQRDAAWLPATVNGATGRIIDTKVRSSSTAVVRDEALADRLYERVRPRLPTSMVDQCGGRPRRVKPVGLYQPLRVYRYEPGQRFAPHHDQSYQDGSGRRSLLTFMIYLNDDFTGGTTTFPDQKREIHPRPGTALLFQHMLLHCGEQVVSGVKYVLRSDVIFGE